VSVVLIVRVPSKVFAIVKPPVPRVREGVAVPAKVTVPFRNVRLFPALAPEIVMVLAPVALLAAEINKSSAAVVVVWKEAPVPAEFVFQKLLVPQTPLVESLDPAVEPFVSQYKFVAIAGVEKNSANSVKAPTSRAKFGKTRNVTIGRGPISRNSSIKERDKRERRTFAPKFMRKATPDRGFRRPRRGLGVTDSFIGNSPTFD